MGGLADRQRFHVSTEEHRAVLLAEKQRMDSLKADVDSSAFIQDYSPKQRAKLLQGEWRVGKSWANLSDEAGFHTRWFNDTYSYLCAYSHSGYLSALQVGQADSIEDQRMLTRPILQIGVVIMAHFALTYTRVFDSAYAVLSSRPEARKIAEIWRFGRDEMARIYER